MEDSVTPPFHLKEMYTLSRNGERVHTFSVQIKPGCCLSLCYRPADRAGWRLSASACASHLLTSIHAGYRACKSIHILIQMFQEKRILNEIAHFVFICTLFILPKALCRCLNNLQRWHLFFIVIVHICLCLLV